MDLPFAEHLDVLTSYLYEGAPPALRDAIDRALLPPRPPRLVHGLPAPDWWPDDDQIAAEGEATARALGAAV